MTRKEIEDLYQAAINHIYQRRFRPAVTELSRMLRFTTVADFFYRLETAEENYKTLLKYTMEGYQDPQRDRILQNLYSQLLFLADDLRQSLIIRELPYLRMQKSLLDDLPGFDETAFIKTLQRFFRRVSGDLPTGQEPLISYQNTPLRLTPHEMDQVFFLITLSGRIGDAFVVLLRKIFNSETVAWYEKSVMISALTTGLLNQFDPQKILLLIELAEAKEEQVYQRGLAGLILALLLYDKRLSFFPDIMERLRLFSQEKSLIPEIELVLMQFLKARETDRITREFEEEVLPEMKKMMPKVEDKLQMNDQTHDEDLEGKNPGWKDMIEEVPGLLEKIEKFSRLQMEGGDVFMSTFRQLKRFDFFNRISNWFVPFHREHPAIQHDDDHFNSINARLMDSLEKAFYICNSDKYSFALNFNAIPEQQRSMIVANFEAEFAQMRDMAGEEQLLDQSLTTNAIYIQYIQDLYRFYKLFPSKFEFEDIFQLKPRLSELSFYKMYFSGSSFPEKTAAFHFDKGHYQEAAESYEDLVSLHGPAAEYYEKIGFSYQRLGQYVHALEAYKKAELFDGDHLWLFKKIGLCYLKVKDYHNALKYFREALTLQSGDLTLQLQIGQCLIHVKDFESASHLYQQSRFFAPENLKVLRPLAYCLFILGKLPQAEEHYLTICSKTEDLSPYDLMNAANVKLCLGKLKESLDLYQQSFRLPAARKKDLMEAFDQDIPYLLRNGIPEVQVSLLRDHLIYGYE
jgi:tetratricopeptide (TPR) repeat protein